MDQPASGRVAFGTVEEVALAWLVGVDELHLWGALRSEGIRCPPGLFGTS